MPRPHIKKENLKLIPTHLWSKECFACGTSNPYGIHMEFYSDGQKYVTSSVNLGESFSGWHQLVHGGIIATILDELMAWTVIYMTRNIMLTKTIKITYHERILINSEIQAFAWIQKIKARKGVLRSELYDSNNSMCAQAVGNYVIFPIKLAKKLHLMSEENIADFERFLSVCT